MTSSYYHFWRSTNAVYKVRMHIITVSEPFFNQNTAFNDFKEEFVNRIREKLKKKFSERKYTFLGRACFGG